MYICVCVCLHIYIFFGHTCCCLTHPSLPTLTAQCVPD